ncbi:unnamed protein product, partial [Musa acuminata var. zebrina]
SIVLLPSCSSGILFPAFSSYSAAASASAPNVSLALCYEKSCRNIANIVVNYLGEIDADRLLSIVGNARSRNGTISCWLELQYGAQTDSLEPPQGYIYWVVVDGHRLYEDYDNFEGDTCKASTRESPKDLLWIDPPYPTGKRNQIVLCS